MSTAAAPQIKVNRLSLFGTPLAVQVLPDAARLNEGLAPALMDLAREAPEGPGDGWRRALEPGGPLAERLAPLIGRSISLAKAMGSAPDGEWSPRLWLEVLRPGQGRAIGSVPEAVWCARYVLDDGGTAMQRDYGARFEAQDPRGVGPVMYAPHLSIADPAGPSLGVSQTIGLKTGALLVYPGWLLHGLELYRGPEAFISLQIELLR